MELNEQTIEGCCQYFLKEHQITVSPNILRGFCDRFGIKTVEQLSQETDFVLSQIVNSQSSNLPSAVDTKLSNAVETDAKALATALKAHPKRVVKTALTILETEKNQPLTIHNFKSKLNSGITIGTYLNHNRQYSILMVGGLLGLFLLVILVITLGVERHENNRIIREYATEIKSRNASQN